MKTLLCDGLVITMDSERRVLRADILVVHDRIATVTPRKSDAPRPCAGTAEDGADVVDLHGMTVIPGLVQAHRHVTQARFRGLCDDLALRDRLRERTWPMAASLTMESNAASARLAAMAEA